MIEGALIARFQVNGQDSRGPTTQPAVRRGRARRTMAGLAATGGLAAATLLGGCAQTPPTPPVTTVTVFPDETTLPGQTPPRGTASGPSSVPTVTAPGQSAPTPSPEPSAAPPVRVGALRGAPDDFAQAKARMAKAKRADADAQAVQSPSGNIYCTATDDGASVGCEVSEGRAAAPKSAPCPGGGGAQDIGRLELGSAGATPICNSDTIRSSKPRTLAYGKRWAVPTTAFTCLSEKAGITCIDAKNKHGFFIARATYATF